MSKRFAIVLAICAALFIGMLVFTKDKADAPDNKTGGTNTGQTSNHVKGEGKSGVILIEYGDLQCSACWGYEPVLREVYNKYKDQITFQYRNFPLASLHPNAFAAHRAVEAAHKQGKFWEMHDLLYDHAYKPGSIPPEPIEWTATKNPQPYFEEYAKQLGLNVQQFKQDMASSAVNEIINADLRAGKDLRFNSTPSFVLDGKPIDNPTSVDQFNKILDAAIKAKTGQ